jgi:hypothetical protein
VRRMLRALGEQDAGDSDDVVALARTTGSAA